MTSTDIDDQTAAPVPCRFAWRYLDAEEASQLWDELVDWVGWWRYRYQLESRVKACWFQHGAVVEELTALMVAHTAVYVTEAKARAQYREDLTAWHTHWMLPIVERLNRISDFSGCGPDGCKHEPKQQPTLRSITEFIAADLAARPDPAPRISDNVPRGSEQDRKYFINNTEMNRLRSDGQAQAVHTDGRSARFRYADEIWIYAETTGGWIPEGSAER